MVQIHSMKLWDNRHGDIRKWSLLREVSFGWGTARSSSRLPQPLFFHKLLCRTVNIQDAFAEECLSEGCSAGMVSQVPLQCQRDTQRSVLI